MDEITSLEYSVSNEKYTYYIQVFLNFFLQMTSFDLPH